MNFAYIDAHSLLEQVLLSPQPETVETVPCELDERWTEFENELGKFKTEFAKARIEHSQLYALLNEKREELSVVKMMKDNINSPALKNMIASVIDSYEDEEGLDGLAERCGIAAGKVDAMKNVLLDTNSERYAKFTCFVCMDRLVDLFMDPCGHVMCDRCWTRLPTKTQCPGCRTRLEGAKKIFSMC